AARAAGPVRRGAVAVGGDRAAPGRDGKPARGVAPARLGRDAQVVPARRAARGRQRAPAAVADAERGGVATGRRSGARLALGLQRTQLLLKRGQRALEQLAVLWASGLLEVGARLRERQFQAAAALEPRPL